MAAAIGSSGTALASPGVEFDIARAVECRDVTPGERILQYPDAALDRSRAPVSVRFNELSHDDVDEINIEVSGATAGLRVQDFAPATQLASEFTREIETTTTNKKARSLEATLGGTLPVPGAEAAAHITPSITGGMAGCETATEKINRLPPKHVVVVSGTYAEGRGVFFKLKRTNQTSLEGVHELAVTFVAPPELGCHPAPSGMQCAWAKENTLDEADSPLGHIDRYVQMMPATIGPINQTVLKPTGDDEPKVDEPAVLAANAASPTRWRPARPTPNAKATDKPAAAPAAVATKPAAAPFSDVKAAKVEMATADPVQD